MYNLKIKLDNVSLRAFLFLIDQNNKGKEFSNSTICDYIRKTFSDQFTEKYKDL